MDLARTREAREPSSPLQIHCMRQPAFSELIDGAQRAPDKEEPGSYRLNVDESRMETGVLSSRNSILGSWGGGELEPINGVFMGGGLM